MKLTHVMIAVAALAGVAQANATGIVRLTGSSASSTNVVRGLYNACTAGGGTTTVYKTTSSTSNLGNQITVACSKNFDGTTGGTATNEVRINVAGGSYGAVSATTAATDFLVGSGSCAAVGNGTGSLSFLNAGQMKNCGTTLADHSLSDGGYMDVEPPFFGDTSASYFSSGFSQVFGIGVNKALYNDLQAFEKTAAGGSIVPTSCAVGDTTPSCQPSLSKAQIASLINNDYYTAKALGGAYLIPASFSGRPSGYSGTINLGYCMRPQTSGTQQSAQLYFLGYALNGPQGGAEQVADENASYAPYFTFLNSGTGNVKNCLNDQNPDGSAISGAPSATTTGYRFGAVSLENNPVGTSDTWRFVRVQQVEATEGVAGASNTASALSGRYDDVFELQAHCANTKCEDLINNTIYNNVQPGQSSPGIFVTGVESTYSRNGNNSGVYLNRY